MQRYEDFTKKFFYIEQSSDNRIWLKLTDGFNLFPLRPAGLGEEDKEIQFSTVKAAVRAVQKYNDLRQTNYPIRTNIK